MFMRSEEFVMKATCDEHKIYTYKWFPDSQVKLKGIIQLVHGSCEHVRRYEAFARFLTSRGYGVYAHDQRGHGYSVVSQDDLGYFGENRGWDKLVEDCYQVNQFIHENHENKKVVMLGHSMGSFVARHYAIEHSHTIDGLILIGTAHHSKEILDLGIRIAQSSITKGNGKKVHKLLDKMSYGAFPLKFRKEKDPLSWITTDKQIRDIARNDELFGFKFTATAFRDMFLGIKFITQVDNMKKMRSELPILLLSGEDDPVGNFGKMVRKTQILLQEAGMKKVDMKLYPGMRHEILNEVKRAEVYQNILAWLEKNIK